MVSDVGALIARYIPVPTPEYKYPLTDDYNQRNKKTKGNAYKGNILIQKYISYYLIYVCNWQSLTDVVALPDILLVMA